MLTLDELLKRLERDEEKFEELTRERESLRIRLYRYRKAIAALKEISECGNDLIT